MGFLHHHENLKNHLIFFQSYVELFIPQPTTSDGVFSQGVYNLIINSRGLFIIEVKNYSGEMFGSEEDYEWVKIKTTAEGNIYQKTIKNPINQVKRQIYILSRLLKEHGLDGIWIEGYVFFVEMNSPVESPYVLRTQQDIDEVIHNGIDNGISSEVIEQLTGLLDEEL